MKRNIIRPLEASAILDGLADLADQVVSQLLGGNAVPLRASAAPDDPDAGNSRDWSRETVSAEVRSIETIGARLWAFGRTFRRGFSELVAFLRDHEFVALDFGGLSMDLQGEAVSEHLAEHRTKTLLRRTGGDFRIDVKAELLGPVGRRYTGAHK